MAVQDFLWLVDSLQKDDTVAENSKQLLGRISEEFSKTVDKELYLKELYKVNGFGELSIAGLWFLKKKDTTDIDAIAYERIKEQIETMTRLEIEEHQTSPPEQLHSEADSSQSDIEQATQRAGLTKGIDSTFGNAYDKFVVAMQTGDPEGKNLALNIMRLLEDILKDNNLAAIEREVSTVLYELLSFITENDIMDDVRVMNLLLNFEDSMNQAIQKENEERESFFHEALDVIREYRTLFE